MSLMQRPDVRRSRSVKADGRKLLFLLQVKNRGWKTRIRTIRLLKVRCLKIRDNIITTIQKNQLLSDKSSIIPSAGISQVFNGGNVEKKNEGYNAEEVEYYTEVVKQNIDYGYLGDWLTADGRDGYAEADNIVGFIVDEICSPLPYTTLRGTSFPRSVIKSKMLQANIYMVESVLVKMAQVDNIKDFRRYFISSLYNEVLTYHFNEGCESRWAVQAVARDFGYAV